MEIAGEDLGYVPDAEHLETVMDGIIDTVQGTEGHGLTHAQQYLNGTLYAAGMISAHTYHGTEGVLDDIKKGFLKAWEYVTKAVKAIFQVFFKTEAKKDAASAKSSLKALEDALSKPAPKTPQEYRKQVSEMVREGAKLAHMNTGGKPSPKLEKAVEELREIQTEINRAEGDDVLEKMKKQSEEAKARFRKLIEEDAEVVLDFRVQRAKEMVEKLTVHMKYLQNVHSDKDDLSFDTEEIAQSIQKLINGINGWLTTIDGFKRWSQAREYVSKTRSTITAVEHSMMDFQSSEQYFNQKLAKMKSAMEDRSMDEGKRKRIAEAMTNTKKSVAAMADVTSIIRQFFSMTRFFCDCYSPAV
ncbi:hypothetical protein NFI00_000133 [Salmonella enterica]|nr:hypothetical protein [Salmonella enterica]